MILTQREVLDYDGCSLNRLNMRLLKVGQVAKKTGLTVRALHHYEEIGLLKSTYRTEVGHRLYSVEDLFALQKLMMLQQLGFSLKDILQWMHQDDVSLPSLIDQYAAHLSLQVKQQEKLIHRLKKLQEVIAQQVEVDDEFIIETLRKTIMIEKYFSEEQVQQLAARKEAMGDERIHQAEQEWQSLFDAFRILMQDNQLVTSDTAQALAKRALELVEQFTGGDAAMDQSLHQMYEEEGAEKVLNSSSHAMVDQKLWDYMTQAMNIAKNS